MNTLFHEFAKKTSQLVGNAWTFVLALLFVIGWGVLGPLYHFSDTWQLIINTSTTILTFLIVFLIQNTQNRDAEIIQLKLDELIRSIKPAKNSIIDLEKLSDKELKVLENHYTELSEKYAKRRKIKKQNKKTKK